MAEHHDYLVKGDHLKSRDRARLMEMVHSIVRESALNLFRRKFAEFDHRMDLSGQLVSRTLSPYEVAETILSEMAARDPESPA